MTIHHPLDPNRTPWKMLVYTVYYTWGIWDTKNAIPKNSCGAPGVSKPSRDPGVSPHLRSETSRVASDVMMTFNQLTEATVSTEAGGQNWRMVLVDLPTSTGAGFLPYCLPILESFHLTNTTVDGSEIPRTHQSRLVVSPMI